MLKYKRPKGLCGICGGRTSDKKVSTCHDCSSELKADYMPTEEQIKIDCIIIRKEWSDEEKWIRNQVGSEPISGIRCYSDTLREG